jgi:hypothetical protein
MSFTFDYLGKFKFILEMNLGYELGYQVDIYGEKPRGQNSHASVPLRCLKKLYEIGIDGEG